jgi:hypothetical protein
MPWMRTASAALLCGALPQAATAVVRYGRENRSPIECADPAVRCAACRRRRRHPANRQRTGLRFRTLPRSRKILRHPSGVHPPTHARAERRRRIVHGNAQGRVRLVDSIRYLRASQDSHPSLGEELQRDPPALAAWVSTAGRRAPPAGRNKRLTCPETAGSLQPSQVLPENFQACA